VLAIGTNGGNEPVYCVGFDQDRQKLQVVSEQRDLGILMDSGLKFDEHVSRIVASAGKMLGIIKRNFKDMGTYTFICLYKAMVRSRLEYGQSVWSPYRVYQIEELEKVQRRATKILPGLRNLPYTMRLKRLKLPTLAYRRVRGDMIETYKIIHGLYDVEACPQLSLSHNITTRGHNFKLVKKHARLDVRQHFFTFRIVNVWNSLPFDVVNAGTLNTFKNCLDRYWKSQDLLYNHRACLDL
jgi:hypothetical protein